MSDSSRKGIQVISTIHDVSKRLTSCKKTVIIFNRVRDGFAPSAISETAPVLAVVGDDSEQAENDMQGESVFNLAADSPLFCGAKAALSALIGEDLT